MGEKKYATYLKADSKKEGKERKSKERKLEVWWWEKVSALYLVEGAAHSAGIGSVSGARVSPVPSRATDGTRGDGEPQ